MLFDKNGEVLCVIDLDTVMPSFIFSDYGDFLRTAANKVAEDCPQIDKVEFDMEIFKAFTKGYIESASSFLTPVEKENLACVSIYDVFPTSITVPLSGKGQEVAVLFIASTYCMQAYVENARITVTYADGTTTYTKLVYPLNIDDWLTSALTTEAEIFYFSNFNHATVQRIRIDPDKELASIKIEAVANEVVLGVAGISVSR
jgi:hypothetical protein